MRRGQGAVVVVSSLSRVEGGSGGYANPCHGYGYKCRSARPYLYLYPRDTRHVTRAGYPYPWYSLSIVCTMSGEVTSRCGAVVT